MVEDDKVNEKFEEFKKTSYSEADLNKTLNKEEAIKAKAKKGPLKEFAEYIGLFFLMLSDTFTGKYKEIPKGTIAVITATLLYVLSPFDLVPDFIPVVGLLDDAAILALCIPFVAADVEKYKKFKNTKDEIQNLYEDN